jgi:hypothetical protein
VRATSEILPPNLRLPAEGAVLLATLSRQHTVRCIARLAEVLDGNDPAAAVTAAPELLNRGYGMPQPFSADGIHIELNEAEETHRPNGESAWNTG